MTFLRSRTGKIILIVVSSVLFLCAVVAGLGFWYYQMPKFQNITVELGTESVSMQQFLTKYAIADQVGFVGQAPDIDLRKLGSTEFLMQQWGKEEKVTLTVQDTTAPKVVFTQMRTVFPDYEPNVQDFIQEISDLSETKAYFDPVPTPNDTYTDSHFQVVVEDAGGNKTVGDCTLHYVWLLDKFTMELGQKLTKEDILYNTEVNGGSIPDKEINAVNKGGIGVYQVCSTIGDKQLQCEVTVQDTLGPDLKLKELTIYIGQKATLKQFIKSCEDPSGGVKTKLVKALDFSKTGTQDVTVEAVDSLGNVTTKTTKLHIITDKVPPVISGLKTLSVKRGTTPNYLKGVTAKDAMDGACTVSVNTDKVDLNKAGTYYAVYTSSDTSGNTKTAKRKIVVEHNEEDTLALVKSIAAGLGSDPTQLSQYVRKSIKYNHNWGGSDPVWYGIKNKKGNCYVHAMVLQAIFKEKGISSKLIWVTDKSHYWLLVKVGGNWRHIDPTPGTKHPAYLMNDEQRYKNLQGRDWDRSKWPACP